MVLWGPRHLQGSHSLSWPGPPGATGHFSVGHWSPAHAPPPEAKVLLELPAAEVTRSQQSVHLTLSGTRTFTGPAG